MPGAGHRCETPVTVYRYRGLQCSMVSDSPSDHDPFGEDNPFMGMPIFGDLAHLLRQQGPMSWDAARQLAFSVATGNEPEPNVDPLERIRIEQLARVAELQVADATGLETSVTGKRIELAPVTRAQWAQRTLEAYRPLFEELAGSVNATGTPPTSQPTELGVEPGDPLAWMAPLMQMIGPMMLGMMAGSMVGHLSRRAFGQYDLPIPRPPSDELILVPANIDEFGEGWSLPADDLRLWICVHEVTHHAVLGVAHVRSTLDSMLRQYLSGFEASDVGIEQRLGELELADPTQQGGMVDLERLFGDPEVLLGAIQSTAQRELLPRLEALVAAIVGYVDHVMDLIGARLITSYGMVTEALRRRRVEADPSDRFVERLFGLELTQAQYDRGSAFIAGIVERAGEGALARLWESERTLPTPAEIDAPGLWLARIELPDD